MLISAAKVSDSTNQEVILMNIKTDIPVSWSVLKNVQTCPWASSPNSDMRCCPYVHNQCHLFYLPVFPIKHWINNVKAKVTLTP